MELLLRDRTLRLCRRRQVGLCLTGWGSRVSMGLLHLLLLLWGLLKGCRWLLSVLRLLRVGPLVHALRLGVLRLGVLLWGLLWSM
jgi:hypothetical protein